MKNIHVLPTDKPSRLFYNVGGALLFTNYENYSGVNIYITSDVEIKEGDWQLSNDKHITIRTDSFHESDKKIILTTDQDLIKDGVQAIDDKFLEWFVKNPSCEYVKIEDYGNLYNFRYLIIIPKEEPKQETLEYGLLQHIKMCLECNNESQAIRLLEKYGFEKQEEMHSGEEVIQIIRDFKYDSVHIGDMNPEKWFEHFKNK